MLGCIVVCELRVALLPPSRPCRIEQDEERAPSAAFNNRRHRLMPTLPR